MIYDYYAHLHKEQKKCPREVNESGLVSGFVDICTVWLCWHKPQGKEVPDPKNEAHRCYMKRTKEMNIQLPSKLNLEPDFSHLPDSSWLGIQVSFTLETHWYSADNRFLHVLDNPVRKDRVFGVPLMSAASWKGLLRWACRMKEGLLDHLKTHAMKMDGWKDPTWIVHLFGNEKGEDEHFQRGAMVFYPTWFNKVDFEVINPHSRARRAGTQPIYYEVVPAETKGWLWLLYAPLPGEVERDGVNPAETLSKFIDAVELLLQTYGISAKRTAGWGTAKINDWYGFWGSGCSVNEKTAAEFKTAIKKQLLTPGGGHNEQG